MKLTLGGCSNVLSEKTFIFSFSRLVIFSFFSGNQIPNMIQSRKAKGYQNMYFFLKSMAGKTRTRVQEWQYPARGPH